jgi:hypothetical protein
MKLISATLEDDGCEITGLAHVEVTEAEVRALDQHIIAQIERGVSMGTAQGLVAQHREYMAIIEAFNRLRR